MNDQGGQHVLNREHPIVIMIVFFLIAYFPTFLKLDVLPLRVWDEARNAVSAYEMYTTGNLLVAHYEGTPDMWGVKPPMLLWMQTLFYHLLGPGELAVRLPAAIAAFLTGWLFLRYCWRELERPWLGLLACGVLFSSEGFINMHGARSGDHDVPLVFFMCWSLLSIHKWCMHGRRKDLLLFFVLLAFATLTKSVQGLLFLPGVAAYVIAERKLLQLLRERWTYLGICLFLVMVGSFYLSREALNPGYLQAVWDNELWGRYGEVLEGHKAPWDLYVTLLLKRDLIHFYMWVPVGVVLGLFHQDTRVRKWTLLLTLTFLGYLLVVSNSATKLHWYVAPMMPLLAGLAAMAMYTLLEWMTRSIANTNMLRSTRALPYLFLFVVFATPWSFIVAINYKAKEWPWQLEPYKLSHYLKDASRGIQELEPNVVVNDAHYAHLLFYVHLLNEQGHRIEMRSVEALQPGDMVISDQPHIKDHIEATYPNRSIWTDEGVTLHEILGQNIPEGSEQDQTDQTMDHPRSTPSNHYAGK